MSNMNEGSLPTDVTELVREIADTILLILRDGEFHAMNDMRTRIGPQIPFQAAIRRSRDLDELHPDSGEAHIRRGKEELFRDALELLRHEGKCIVGSNLGVVGLWLLPEAKEGAAEYFRAVAEAEHDIREKFKEFLADGQYHRLDEKVWPNGRPMFVLLRECIGDRVNEMGKTPLVHDVLDAMQRDGTVAVRVVEDQSYTSGEIKEFRLSEVPLFILHCWNSTLTHGATNIDEMIDKLQAATDRLCAMRDVGVTLGGVSGQMGEHIGLATTDSVVAQRFGFQPETGHKQAHVKVSGQEADIDERLVPLVREIWRAHIHTDSSCQDLGCGMAYISFSSVADAAHFLDVVACPAEGDTIYNRIMGWSDDGEAGPVWEFNAVPRDFGSESESDFEILVRIKFPASDLPLIFERLVRHNRTE